MTAPSLAQVRRALRGYQPERAPDAGPRPAAVLVPLLELQDGLHVLFTRRSEKMTHHSGQVSFPGGRIDPGETPEHAALREAEEEVGLRPEHVELVGRLDDVPTFVTGFVIAPIVGVVDKASFTAAGRYPWSPSAAEIDELYELPIAEFLVPENLRVEEREVEGAHYQLLWYTVRGTVVWGATARILRRLLDLSLAIPEPG